MYEHKRQPLAPTRVFYQRVFFQLLLACLVLAVCLVIGLAGYYFLTDATCIDAFHNASMILSGMGPVITITTSSGKIFSSLYALFSGIVFITNIGLILAPVIHRIFHKLHLEEQAKD